MLEDIELGSETKIDRATTELVGRQIRADPDFALFDISLDVDVGKDHGKPWYRELVDGGGIEPPTSALRTQRSPS